MEDKIQRKKIAMKRRCNEKTMQEFACKISSKEKCKEDASTLKHNFWNSIMYVYYFIRL